MQVPSAITIIPPDPRVLSSFAKSADSSLSGMISSARSIFDDTPPGMTAFIGRPCNMPPHSLARKSANG